MREAERLKRKAEKKVAKAEARALKKVAKAAAKKTDDVILREETRELEP